MSAIQFTASKCYVTHTESVILKGRRYYIVFLRIFLSFCLPFSPAKWKEDTKKQKLNNQSKI